MKNDEIMLVKKVKKGNIDALEELIKLNQLKLYKTACAFLDSPADVDDAIQKAIISVYKNISGLKKKNFLILG